MLPDARCPTEAQRQKLCDRMYCAFLEMRVLGWSDKAEQAADLADTFHDLPKGMWVEYFSLQYFRDFVVGYQRKYLEEHHYDYVAMVDEIIAMGES